MSGNSEAVWQQQRKAEALAFRADLEALVADIEASFDPHGFGPHANHLVDVSFARGRSSHHWFTLKLKWGVLVALLDQRIEVDHKDSIILCPGSLSGGHTANGTRKIKDHVEGLDLVFLDFDKGDAPPEKLQARLAELGLESVTFVTFSHLKEETALAWSVTRPNPKTGQTETLPSALQTFTRGRLALGPAAACVPDCVTAEIFRDFMVAEQGFDREILGAATIVAHDNCETKRIKGKDGRWETHTVHNVVAKHNPLAKSRIAIPLAHHFARQPGETPARFQARWQQEVYLPLGELIGFQFDRVCASIERGHYAITCKAGRPQVPLSSSKGRLLDLQDSHIQTLLAPFKRAREEPRRQRDNRRTNPVLPSATNSGEAPSWRGFKAADAAADLLPSITDKRGDAANPLVAFPCPFVHEHATSNDPAAHQCYTYNACAGDKLPTVKCQSASCRDRPYCEFLDALFDEATKADARYRLAQAQQTGVYIPEAELPAKLKEINQAWAVVRLGNRVRYLHETVDGDIELYDGRSLAAWFSNWFYYWINKRGECVEQSILSEWLKWQFRRQYRGLRFCPQPEGAPDGIYNSYFGFTVEPQRGSWKRLLAHIYRNVCRRDPTNFRFFIAWVAQLCQQPDIKPGTNIVLKGKEGVGKSKVGEWVATLFGRNAIVVAESERITGRFNAHLENKLFLMAEEAFWAGDKAAEGKLKDLATGMHASYERKGLDPYEGVNYTRIMIASNEDWVVPASSGGRRWFVLECGDEHEKDYSYFRAIDEEMKSGGLAAMLYDLLHSPLPQRVNVRSAPVTPWLVEQRLHSYDNKRRWWRGVLQEGGFRNNADGSFIILDDTEPTVVRREDVFASARLYFLGPKGVDASPSEIGQFIVKMLGQLDETRPSLHGKRTWCTIFPPLQEMRARWLAETGESIAPLAQSTAVGPSAQVVAEKVDIQTMAGSPLSFAEQSAFDAVAKAVKRGVTDEDELVATAEGAATTAHTLWRAAQPAAKTPH